MTSQWAFRLTWLLASCSTESSSELWRTVEDLPARCLTASRRFVSYVPIRLLAGGGYRITQFKGNEREDQIMAHVLWKGADKPRHDIIRVFFRNEGPTYPRLMLFCSDGPPSALVTKLPILQYRLIAQRIISYRAHPFNNPASTITCSLYWSSF